jgi:glucose-6-phosphate isomerase
MAVEPRPRCDRTPAWAALQACFDARGKSFDLRQAFAADAGRFAHFSQEAPHVFADLSKNLIDSTSEALLLDLAAQCRLEQHRDAMFAGEPINGTEQRAVMHFLLRSPAAATMAGDLARVHETLDAMLAYAEQLRADTASPTSSTSA